MKKQFAVLFLSLMGLLVFTTAAAQEGDRIITFFELDDFAEVSASGALDIVLVQSDEFKVEVRHLPNELDGIDISIKNDVLILKNSSEATPVTGKMKIFVYMPDLDVLTVAGACELDFISFTIDDLQLTVRGACKVMGELVAENINAHVSGAAELVMAGKSDGVALESTGAATVKMSRLNITSSLRLVAGGASKIDACGTGEAIISANGAANVEVCSKMKVISAEKSGAAQVRQAN